MPLPKPLDRIGGLFDGTMDKKKVLRVVVIEKIIIFAVHLLN